MALVGHPYCAILVFCEDGILILLNLTAVLNVSNEGNFSKSQTTTSHHCRIKPNVIILCFAFSVIMITFSCFRRNPVVINTLEVIMPLLTTCNKKKIKVVYSLLFL